MDQVSENAVKKKQRSLLSRIVNVVVVWCIIGVLVAIAAIPLVTQFSRRSRHSVAAWDAKTAVTQAIVYANDYGVYPTSIKVLRVTGYANIFDEDPWGNEWVISPLLTQGRTPREGDNIYVFSRGPEGTGVYPETFTGETGEDGSVGYSSVDGLWMER